MAPAGTMNLHSTRVRVGAGILDSLHPDAASLLPLSTSPAPIEVGTIGNRSIMKIGSIPRQMGNDWETPVVHSLGSGQVSKAGTSRLRQSPPIQHSIMQSRRTLMPSQATRQTSFRQRSGQSGIGAQIPDPLDRSRL